MEKKWKTEFERIKKDIEKKQISQDFWTTRTCTNYILLHVVALLCRLVWKEDK